jgi:peptidyl-prolyl cis-trans isomerase A (cyclophilin A)
MIRAPAFLASLCLALAGCGGGGAANQGPANGTSNGAAPAAPAPYADIVRVRLTTSAGDIVLALDARHAPITTANFLAYVDQHRFDGTSFYRASRTRSMPGRGFVQGGIRRDYSRMLPPIALEPTSRTGLHHVEGTISMARTTPNSAMGDFVIVAGAIPSMDAHPGRPGDNQGYAAFGHVVEGMDVIHRILAAPTAPNAGAGAMRGEMLTAPVRIVSAARVR